MKFYIELNEFKGSEDRQVLAKCSSNTNLLGELAYIASQENDDELADMLANNEHLDKKIISLFADSEFATIRWYAAQDSRIGIDDLKKLSCDEDEEVKMEVTYNPTVTEEILCRLSCDTSDDIKIEVIKSDKVTIPILTAMAKSSSNSSRVRLLAYDRREELFTK